MAEVHFTRPGHRDLEALADERQEQVRAKLHEVADDPDRYLRRLRGYDLYVLRVGDDRVIADWDQRADEVYVHAIGHRRDIYDREL